MNKEAAQEIEATVSRMREKAQSKRQHAENLRGSLEGIQRRILNLVTEAADLDQGADAITDHFMLGAEHVGD